MQNGNKSFLGTGWHFPPAFSKGGQDVRMVSDEEDVQQSIGIILSTGINERVMRNNFGSELNEFLFEEIDESLVNDIQNVVKTALIENEGRVEVEDVNISEGPPNEGLLKINITYSMVSTNTRYNMVYPFYLNEASF